MAKVGDFQIKYRDNSEDAIRDQEVIVKKVALCAGLDFKVWESGLGGQEDPASEYRESCEEKLGVREVGGHSCVSPEPHRV